MNENFVLPGVFDPLVYGDERDLHIGGLDAPQIYGDTFDVFPDDTNLSFPEPDTGKVEQLPQFGPPFVKAVMHRLTKTEEAIGKLVDLAMARWMYESRTDFFFATMQTTGTGGLDQATTPNCIIYEPPPGFTFALHRLTIRTQSGNGSQFATPFTGAASGWELRVDNELIDGNSMISGQGQLPIVATWGTRDAPRVRDGEILSLFMVAGPTNAQIIVKGQGPLDRTIEG